MTRRKIAIVGCGQIGGVLALMLAERELGDILLLDIPEKEGVVKGKALDITQLRPEVGSDARIRGSVDFDDLAGSDLVLITAGMPRRPGMDREDLLQVNLAIVRNLAEKVRIHAPEAFVILTTNPLDAMVYAFHRLSGLPAQRVAGMAGALDTARFRTFIAMEIGISVRDVHCMVMGGHGPTMVPLPRTATVGGVPLACLLSPERIEAVVQRTRDAGTELVKLYASGSAYFSPAAGLLEMAEAYINDHKRLLPAAALCRGEYGIHDLFVGVPCIIGAGGIERIVEMPLAADEQAMLAKTVQAVEEAVAATGLRS